MIVDVLGLVIILEQFLQVPLIRAKSLIHVFHNEYLLRLLLVDIPSQFRVNEGLNLILVVISQAQDLFVVSSPSKMLNIEVLLLQQRSSYFLDVLE